MKVRLCVCAKTLVLILSINVFLCINVVQCTKCLIDIINPILKENGIPIINLQDAVNYSKNVKFGELTNFEKDQDYFKSFLGCLFDNRMVFFKMEFEMDKAWQEKGLFNKLNSIDTAIIFEDIASFSEMLKNAYGDDSYPLKNILEKEQNKIGVESNEEINIDDVVVEKNKNIKKCYYVLTSLDEMKNVIKIVEEGVVKERLTDYFSYTITFLITEGSEGSGSLKLDEDDNPFAYAGHMKAIRGFGLLHLGKIFATEKKDFFKNCYKLQEIFDVVGFQEHIEKLKNLILSCVDDQNKKEFKWGEGKDYNDDRYDTIRIYGIKIKRPEIKNQPVSFLGLFF